MGRPTLTNRVETLENAVDDLRKDAARIEAIDEGQRRLEGQFAQFQSETRLEFSAVHEEIDAGFKRVDAELVKLREGDEETRRFMRVLHEDLVGRIAVLGEQFRDR